MKVILGDIINAAEKFWFNARTRKDVFGKNMVDIFAADAVSGDEVLWFSIRDDGYLDVHQDTETGNTWICRTRPDLSPEELTEFFDTLGSVSGNKYIMRSCIAAKDWELIADVPDADRDPRYTKEAYGFGSMILSGFVYKEELDGRVTIKTESGLFETDRIEEPSMILIEDGVPVYEGRKIKLTRIPTTMERVLKDHGDLNKLEQEFRGFRWVSGEDVSSPPSMVTFMMEIHADSVISVDLMKETLSVKL